MPGFGREWQGAVPDDIEQRANYEIAARHLPKFSKAFLTAIDAAAETIKPRKLFDGVSSGLVNNVFAAIPFLIEGDPAQLELQRSVRVAYAAVIEDAGEAEVERVLRLVRAVDNRVQKAGLFSLDNPYSAKWIEQRSAQLVKGTITDQARAAISSILAEGLGQRTTREIAEDIEAITGLGLTEREFAAMERRREETLKRLIKDHPKTPLKKLEDRARLAADRYGQQLRKKRAMRIARTETVEAEAQGVVQAWRVSRDQGLIDSNYQKEWVAASGTSSRPPCPICMELDEQTVPLDENFQAGTLSKGGPTAHPNCRCTLTLVFVDDDSLAEPVSLSDLEL